MLGWKIPHFARDSRGWVWSWTTKTILLGLTSLLFLMEVTWENMGHGTWRWKCSKKDQRISDWRSYHFKLCSSWNKTSYEYCTSFAIKKRCQFLLVNRFSTQQKTSWQSWQTWPMGPMGLSLSTKSPVCFWICQYLKMLQHSTFMFFLWKKHVVAASDWSYVYIHTYAHIYIYNLCIHVYLLLKTYPDKISKLKLLSAVFLFLPFFMFSLFFFGTVDLAHQISSRCTWSVWSELQEHVRAKPIIE